MVHLFLGRGRFLFFSSFSELVEELDEELEDVELEDVELVGLFLFVPEVRT